MTASVNTHSTHLSIEQFFVQPVQVFQLLVRAAESALFIGGLRQGQGRADVAKQLSDDEGRAVAGVESLLKKSPALVLPVFGVRGDGFAKASLENCRCESVYQLSSQQRQDSKPTKKSAK